MSPKTWQPVSDSTRVEPGQSWVCWECGGKLRRYRDGGRGTPYYAHTDRPLSETAGHQPLPIRLGEET